MPLPSGAAYVDKGKLVVLDSHLSRIRVGTRFYRPHANPCHLEWIFASTREIPRDGAYADHLWQSHIWRYSEDLTPGHVRSADTNFHRWVEPLNVGLLNNYGTPLLAERLRRLLRPAVQKEAPQESFGTRYRRACARDRR